MTHEPAQPPASVSEPQQIDDEGVPETAAPAPTVAHSTPDLTAIRELVLRAHPHVVPELIAGDSVDGLLASIAPAEAAFQRISESLQTPPTATTPANPPVPAGGDRPMPADPSRLPASEKIRRGLARR